MRFFYVRCMVLDFGWPCREGKPSPVPFGRSSNLHGCPPCLEAGKAETQTATNRATPCKPIFQAYSALSPLHLNRTICGRCCKARRGGEWLLSLSSLAAGLSEGWTWRVLSPRLPSLRWSRKRTTPLTTCWRTCSTRSGRLPNGGGIASGRK